ncbi:MAG TPA: carboxypeptidase regulatory-like domain-containing protein [Acidobacteriota bacterium]|jgi:hypothetical protein
MLRKLALLLACIFSAAVPCLGTSELIFPRVAFDGGRFTGFAVANPGKVRARLTLTAYGENGRLLQGAGVTNPLPIDIEPGKQFAQLDSEMFHGYASNPGFKGWVYAQSEADGLTGFFIMGDGKLSMLDGADLPNKALDLYYNLLLDSARYQYEISLVNPNDGTAGITLSLVNSSGTALQTRQISIAGKGCLQATLESLFAAPDIAQSATLKVKSNVPVAGFEFVFARDSSTLTGLVAQPEGRKLSSLHFPQLAVLGDWATQVGVFNVTDEIILISVSAYKADGTLFAAPDIGGNNPFRIAIAPRGAFTQDVQRLFNFRGDSTRVGWLKVETTKQSIHGFVAYGTRSNPTLAAVVAQSDPQGSTNAVFSHQANNETFYTGLAILNAGSLAANIEITSVKSTGEVLGSVKKVLGPLERIADLLSSPQLIPASGGAQGGLVVVRSDTPVFTSELFGTWNGSTLANVPAQQGPADFKPDQGSPRFVVEPPLAPLELRTRQTFRARFLTGTPTGGLTWSVNGINNGDSTVGIIDSQGVYTAPATLPAQSRVTIRATTSDGKQVAGATVDLVQKSAFGVNVNFLRAQTYLNGLKKLYVTELSGLSAKQSISRPLQAGSVNTVISEISENGQKKAVHTFVKSNALAVLPYTDSKETDYLLLSTYDSGAALTDNTGRIIRFNPANGQSSTVASELRQPVAMTLDEASGELLVADQGSNSVVAIAQSQLDPNIKTKVGRSIRLTPRFLFSTNKPGGIAINACDGSIYTADTAGGVIRRYDRKTNAFTTVVTGLQQPSKLLALYGTGVDCPEAFFLLVAEEPTNGQNGKLTVVEPARRDENEQVLVESFFKGLDHIPDISFISDNNPYLPKRQAAILFGEEFLNANDQIFYIGGSGDDYEQEEPNQEDKSFDTFTVTGYVVQDGDGLNGITVRLTTAAGQTVSTTTDIFGFYGFEEVPIGTYTLTPSALNYSFIPASQSVKVIDDDVELADFEANPLGGFTLSGTVTDSRGRPIFDAGVVIVDANLNAALVYTRRDGSFLRRGLPGGLYGVGVFYSALTFQPDVAIVTINANQNLNFAATSRVWKVTGRITPRDGVNPGRVLMEVYDTEADEEYYEYTDANGNYEFSAVPESTNPQRYELWAFQDGFEFKIPSNSTATHYVLLMTGDLVPSQIPFESVFVGYDIFGEVFGFDDKPISGVTIQFGARSVVSDSLGKFTITQLRSNARVTASRPGFTFYPAYIDLDLKRLPEKIFFAAEATSSVPSVPSIQSMGPSVSPGTPVTITGTNFTSDTTRLQVRFGPFNARVISASTTQIRTWVPVESSAGATDVVVAVSGISSAPFRYTVLRPAPFITSVTPPAASGGQTVEFIIRGTNLSGANPGVGIVPDTGLKFINGATVNDTELHVVYTVEGLVSSTRVLFVSFDNITSNDFLLAINPSGSTNLSLTSVQPATVSPGTRVTFDLRGTGFLSAGSAGLFLDSETAGVTLVTGNISSDTSAVATYDIAPDALLGPRNLQLVVGSRVSGAVRFMVAP